MTQMQVFAVSQAGIDEGGPESDPLQAGDEELRAFLYGLLARLLSAPPDRESLDALAEIDTLDAQGDIDLGPAIREMQTLAREVTLAELDDEFHALFIGVGRGELVPHGSWYLTGFLMEKPLVRLRSDLAALGLARQDDVKEPEDHAAALCDVMALLEGDDGEAYVTQAAFFQAHIEPWMGRFFNDLQDAKSARFYRAVGLFGQRFLEIETDYFGRAVTSPNGL
jgi:TorA maturation chaperone TorD